MRRNLLRIALFCTTAIIPPAEVRAAPAAAFIAGLTNGALFTTQGLVGIIGGGPLGAAVAAGQAIGGSFVGRTLLGLGIAAATSARLPKFRTPRVPDANAALTNFAQPISYTATVYGTTRVGGPIGFTGAAGDRRHYVPILAAHEVSGVVEHYLDEYTVGVDGTITDQLTPNVLTNAQDPQYTAPGVLAPRARIEFQRGAPGQAASPLLVSIFPEVTNDYDFAGLCVAYIWAQKPPPPDGGRVYPRGRQWAYTPVLNGHNNIFDPRDNTTKFTRNAALIIAHWIVNILGREVDWPSVAIEADECDTLVATRFEGSIPKWEIGGTIYSNQTEEEQRALLLTPCDGFIFDRPDGKVGFYVGRWIEPDVTLTAGDFLQVTVTEGNEDAPTEICTTYIDGAGSWRQINSGTITLVADERPRKREVQAAFVTNHNQASRIANRFGRSSRPEYRLSGTIGVKGYDLLGKRFFKVTHPALRGGTQTFEVAKLERLTPATFAIQAASSVAGDFDFNAAIQEPDRVTRQEVVSAFVTPPLTGLTAAANGNSSIKVDWDAQEGYLWQQIRWKLSTDTEYQVATIQSGTEYIIVGLVDGGTYDVQGRNVVGGTLANPSGWTPEPPLSVTVIANATPPVALTDFTATLNGSDVDLEWVAPNDPNYFGVILYRGTTTVFADASAIHTEYASSGVVSYTDTPGSGTFYYWAAPINSSGITGPESGPETVTVP